MSQMGGKRTLLTRDYISKSTPEHRQRHPNESDCEKADGLSVTCLNQTNIAYDQTEDREAHDAPVHETDNAD